MIYVPVPESTISVTQNTVGTELRNRLLTCDTSVTLASQSISLVFELSKRTKRVGIGAQEDRQEMVFALCHELS
jgi:hypothetical protein